MTTGTEQRFYLHEVRAIERSKFDVQSTVLLPKQVGDPGGEPGAIDTVPRRIFSVKEDGGKGEIGRAHV